jgi:hypothetical protein
MPNLFTVKIDTSEIDRLAAAFAAAGRNSKVVFVRALNHSIDKARTQIVRDVREQMGPRYVSYAQVRAATAVAYATAGRLEAVIHAADRTYSLGRFGARQTKQGAVAAPWNQRRVFPHTFMVSSLSGNVFVRKGPGRFPIKKLWGPSVPAEMVRGNAKEHFESTAAADVIDRVEHELGAILSGVAPGA